MRRAFALLGLSATLLVAWTALLSSQAIATVEGGCTASIAGVDVTEGHDALSAAVPLQSGSSVPVDGTAPGRVQDLTYTVHVAGGGVQVGSVTIAEDGTSWSGTVDLEKISNATVGVFEVTSDVETTAGPCSGVAYICIEGRSPFTTAAGAGAAALGVGGAILLTLSLARGSGLGAARSSLQGFAGGATAGLGGAVLLQQFCTVPLTPMSAAGVPIALGAAGAVGASLFRRAGTRGARRVARMRTGHSAGAPGGEPTEVLERAGNQAHQAAGHGEGARELVDAGHGAASPSGSGGGGGGGPGGGGPSPAPGAPSGAGGGPSPAPSAPGGGGGAPAGGGPSPAPGAPGGGAPAAGGPSPAPGAPGGALPPPPGAEGGAILPPIVPPKTDEDLICSNCGTANSPDSQFCTNCGTRLGR